MSSINNPKRRVDAENDVQWISTRVFSRTAQFRVCHAVAIFSASKIDCFSFDDRSA
jgi:hypothetical protein